VRNAKQRLLCLREQREGSAHSDATMRFRDVVLLLPTDDSLRHLGLAKGGSFPVKSIDGLAPTDASTIAGSLFQLEEIGSTSRVPDVRFGDLIFIKVAFLMGPCT